MEVQLQELIEQIKKDGVDAAEAQAEAILLSAKAEAERIISEAQAQAIVEMTLGRLSGLERQKIEDRLATLAGIIADLRSILADESKLKAIIKEDLLEIRRRYADDRRTELVPVEDEIIYEDLIEKHTCVITMTHAGYIKRQPASTYSAQRRGGKGIMAMRLTEKTGLMAAQMLVSEDEDIMLITDDGTIIRMPVSGISVIGRVSQGVRVMRVEGESRIVGVTATEREEEATEETEATEE